jgi:hypothetical protein
MILRFIFDVGFALRKKIENRIYYLTNPAKGDCHGTSYGEGRDS